MSAPRVHRARKPVIEYKPIGHYKSLGEATRAANTMSSMSGQIWKCVPCPNTMIWRIQRVS